MVSGRVYGGQAPANTQTPYIVFKQVSGVDVVLDADTEYKADRWEIESFASDYSSGRTLAKQIKEELLKSGTSAETICVIRQQLDTRDEYDESVEQHYQSSDLIIDYIG